MRLSLVACRIPVNDRLAAMLSGVGAALHPNLILTAASGLTEPSFTFLFLAALILFYKQKFFCRKRFSRRFDPDPPVL